MSGPSYPLPVSIGPEGVDKFQIWSTILSQYGNSDILTTLITEINTYLDQTGNLNAFYDYIWNVETAQGAGLDIWGRIVDVSRYINVPANTPNPGGFSFTSGPYEMDDAEYRVVILVKALSNITSASSGNLNKLLGVLFSGRGRCYVLDTGAMTMSYVFEFYLHPFEYVIISSLEVSPRPAAVLANIYQMDPPNTFGFYEGIVWQPFNQGVFANQL